MSNLNTGNTEEPVDTNTFRLKHCGDIKGVVTLKGFFKYENDCLKLACVAGVKRGRGRKSADGRRGT